METKIITLLFLKIKQDGLEHEIMSYSLIRPILYSRVIVSSHLDNFLNEATVKVLGWYFKNFLILKLAILINREEWN